MTSKSQITKEKKKVEFHAIKTSGISKNTADGIKCNPWNGRKHAKKTSHEIILFSG
jgi:hypothetical protein